MARCRRCSKRCHRVFDAMLGKRHHIHVAFDDHGRARRTDRRSRLKKPVELVAFHEQRRLRGIEVLRFPSIEDTATKSDHPPTGIVNGEHDAIAKAVVAFAAFARDDQARRLQRSVLVVRERCSQRLPVVRGITHPEASRDRSREPATLEVVDGARGFLELCPIEARRLEEHTGEIRRLFANRRHARRFNSRHVEPGIPRQLFDSVREGLAPILHEKSNGRSVGSASEAVIELLGGTDGEGRCFFGMKRAAGRKIGPRLFQGYIAVDDRNDVDPSQQGLDEIVGNHGFRPHKAMIIGRRLGPISPL